MQIKRPLIYLSLIISCLIPEVSAENTPQTNRLEENNSERYLPRHEDRDDSVSVGFGFYKQNDGAGDRGGNPNIDEDETVYEAIILLDKSLNDQDRFNIRVVGDLISSASQSRFHNPQFRALQSNPSGNKRAELGGGWSRQEDDYSFGFNGSFSIEASEYYSMGYGSNFSKKFRDDLTTLSVIFQGYTDIFVLKLFDGTEPNTDYRQTLTSEIGLTHTLSPSTVANLTFNYTQQFGFLATTFNSVFINGVEFSETAPSKRRRNSLTGRIRQGLWPSNAAELGYRFYNDSWGINSHTLELNVSQYLAKRHLLIAPSYRFYVQDAANFYQMNFTTQDIFRTSDPDLGNFIGHIAGLKISVLDIPVFTKWANDISLGFNYYFRDDGLDIYWIEAGYAWHF